MSDERSSPVPKGGEELATRQEGRSAGTPISVRRDADDATTQREAGGVATTPGRIGVHEPIGWDDPERYERIALLGRGGIGEVHVHNDARLGREVAIKRLQPDLLSKPRARGRFLREALVQGQLEHPAIVPLYDLGRSGSDYYFSMKRVRGMSLEAVLEGLRAGEGWLSERFTRNKLLNAFVTVMQAVSYAHARGVIHRDLKPGNIMMGDFGQVYVLDWGVARVLGITDGPDEAVVDYDQEETMDGTAIGTAGYAAPEQLEGHIDEIGPQSDIYSLGAILFQILTHRRLATGSSTRDRIDETMGGVDVRAAAGDADVPPELLDVCERATQLAPEDRYPEVYDMIDAVESYLDGDRNMELRRTLARDHAEQAEASRQRAAEGDEHGARREALQAVGRALALDPENSDAFGTLVALLSDPPKATPDAVQQELDDENRATLRRLRGPSLIAYLSPILFVPLVWAMGVRDTAAFVAALAAIAVVVISISGFGRWWDANERGLLPGFIASNLVIASLSTIFGPLFVVPAFAALNLMGFLMLSRRTVPLIVIAASSFLGVVALQSAGVLRASYAFASDGMRILPWMIDLPSGLATALLIATNIGLLAFAALWAIHFRNALDQARRNAALQMWQLRQLTYDATSSDTQV